MALPPAPRSPAAQFYAEPTHAQASYAASARPFAYAPVRRTAGLATAIYILVGIQVVATLVGSLQAPPQILVTATSINVNWGGLTALGAIVGVAAGIVGLVFIHRTVSNVRALGLATQYSPGWAVGCWFIPLANFVLPFFPVREAWTKSRAGSVAVVGAWWATWVLHALLASSLLMWGVVSAWGLRSSVAAGQVLSAPLPAGFAATDVVSSVVLAAAGVLFVLVVRGLSRSQAQQPTARR